MPQPVQTQKWFTLITIVLCTIVYIFVGSKQARNELPLSGGNIESGSTRIIPTDPAVSPTSRVDGDRSKAPFVRTPTATRAPTLSPVPLTTDSAHAPPQQVTDPQSPATTNDADSQLDVTSIQQMEQQFRTATNAMINSLKKDYGDRYFNDMFYDKRSDQSWGRTLFKAPAENQGIVTSKDRFRNKMKIKLLEVLQGGKNVTFVWATGGHSATAGHGNFYDESYTAVLERTVQSVFRSIGIQFTGRNYAVGGTASAPETAWCIESIFGADDLDVVVWDYGMTDGRDTNKMMMYCYRVGLHRKRPACLAYHLGRGSQPRQSVLKELEDRGMTTLYSDEAVLEAVEATIPDSEGISVHEVSEIPLFVRNFRCGKLIESGEPRCGIEKFNNTLCEKRRFKTSWHPGWKWHALQGNLVAMYLVEVITDALQEIRLLGMAKYRSTIVELQQEEIRNYQNFMEASLPASATLVMSDPSDLVINDMYRTPNFCHTARLPAEIRHKGILLEGLPGDLYSFEEGISFPDAIRNVRTSEIIPLVQDDSDRQHCELTLNMDHKDFFFVSDKDGWKKIILPNNAEAKEYSRGQALRGLVAMCFAVCPWGRCPKGNLLARDLNETTARIEVNGQTVTSFAKIMDCDILVGESGMYWPIPASGRMEIRIRVLEQKSYVRVGAFVLW